ncbi:MAG TPA: sigma-70 family RNA polymerase sigma factor [Streptosporangiaceae bacterium]|nr:sigma-70 family RNA polymerase sigma factor [Streptosporangiaceae bacterium]
MPDHDASWEQREQRFGVLYREHYRNVWAYAVRRIDSQTDAGDVVADVFTIAWRRLSEVPDPPGDVLWLYGVARRVVAGKRRSARRVQALIARLQANPVTVWTGGDDQLTDLLLEAVARLRPAEREVIALVHWEQLSHDEAARVLGCSANAVAIRVHRARSRLRRALAELAGQERAQPEARREHAGAIVADSPKATEG